MADQKVFVSDGELRQFELAGISREMLHQDIKRGLADGLPPQEIELRIAAKAERLEKAFKAALTVFPSIIKSHS